MVETVAIMNAHDVMSGYEIEETGGALEPARAAGHDLANVVAPRSRRQGTVTPIVGDHTTSRRGRRGSGEKLISELLAILCDVT